MKIKLLSILALLLFVSSAWAESTITVYATNTASWSKMSIYYWGGSYNDWPGTAMENFYTDGSGKKYYRITIPAGVSGILFTNGVTEHTKQSVDITSDIADGAWWEISGTSNYYNAEYKGIVPYGNCGTSGHESEVTWILTEDEVLTISGTGAMADYESYTPSKQAPWYANRSDIKNVVVENGVTSIGNHAFNSCTNMTSVSIPSSVTSIGNNAFANCSQLASVTIPNSVKTIAYCAFERTALTSITIPASVTSITRPFCYCSNLASVTVEAGNTKYDSRGDCNAIISSGNVLITGCKNTVIPSTVTSIGLFAFQGHSGLTSIDIPSGVTSIGEMAFEDCTDLATFSIPARVMSVGEKAFRNTAWFNSQANGLIYKDNWLLGYKGSKPTGDITITDGTKGIANYCFMNCTGLTNVTIPTSVSTIPDYGFFMCSGLTSITIPNSVTNIRPCAFQNCSNLTSITLNSNPSINTSAFSGIKSGATITMNLMVNKAAEGEYWTTFYNQNYSFEAASGTQIFKAALSGTNLTLTKLETDKIITKDKAVILKSNASPMVFTLTTSNSGNSFDGNSLKGVIDYYGLTATGTQYVLNKTAENGVGFYRMSSGKVIGVGKAYLTYAGVSLAPAYFPFFEDVDGVEELKKASTLTEESYDLMGRPAKPNSKGFRITKGHKKFVK